MSMWWLRRSATIQLEEDARQISPVVISGMSRLSLSSSMREPKSSVTCRTSARSSTRAWSKRASAVLACEESSERTCSRRSAPTLWRRAQSSTRSPASISPTSLANQLPMSWRPLPSAAPAVLLALSAATGLPRSAKELPRSAVEPLQAEASFVGVKHFSLHPTSAGRLPLHAAAGFSRDSGPASPLVGATGPSPLSAIWSTQTGTVLMPSQVSKCLRARAFS
mmetsp:Transcript_29272/g.59048  ORF Transcript_29272/g.59048 Transcript_29272/m.59048 type:complete len:223 (+) Transcript_29272:652-1320(+)